MEVVKSWGIGVSAQIWLLLDNIDTLLIKKKDTRSHLNVMHKQGVYYRVGPQFHHSG
jgi:hypothetical protein